MASYDSHTSPEDDSNGVASSSQVKPPPPLCIQQKSRRNKRKRSTEEDSETLSGRLRDFQQSPHSLRISASSVAALCGLHPYQNLPQLFFDLVYQSHLGQLLLQNDTSLLGLQLVDAKQHEREQLLAMAASISHETKQLVQTSLAVSDGTTKLQSVEDVQSIQRQIKTNAQQSDTKLTQTQINNLVDASRHNLSTGFGTSHEDDALDAYEGVVGCRVRERNEALMTWKFERVDQTRSMEEDYDGDDERNNLEMGSDITVTARPMGEAKRREWGEMMSVDVNDHADKKNDNDVDDAKKSERESKVKSEENEVEVIDVDATDTSATANTTSLSVREQQQQSECFFKIVGAVDGIRDEVYIEPPPTTDANNVNQATSASTTEEYNFSDDDDTNGQWRIRPIIVECKHRMLQAKVPPPLYDQIQTCLYMNMYNVEEADLIQVVRRSKKPSAAADAPAVKNEEGVKGKENDQPIQTKTVADTDMTAKCDNDIKEEGKHEEKKKDNDIQITISRIALNDPVHKHQYHWNQTLLPRLASFVDAVYNVRKDDGKRYRLLMALVQEQNYYGGNNDDDESNVEAWKILWDEMPWLRSCDTAFGRKGKRR